MCLEMISSFRELNSSKILLNAYVYTYCYNPSYILNGSNFRDIGFSLRIKPGAWHGGGYRMNGTLPPHFPVGRWWAPVLPPRRHGLV